MSEPQCVIRLESEGMISGAVEFKTSLLQAISSGKEVELNMAYASEIDITAVQLLWATAREAEKQNTSLYAVGPLAEAVSDAFIEAGFGRLLEALTAKAASPDQLAAGNDGDDRQV